MELLGKHGILSKEVSVIEAMLSSCISLSHTDAINNIAISLRQRYKIKTPDALIAATAIHNNLPLLTADTGFTRIKELNIVLIEL